MNKISGLNISKLGFRPLPLGDLINYEGPIVSHFTNADNPHEHYIYKWVDSDDSCNRWLIAKTTEESISKFLFKQISLLQIIIQNEFIYILDLDDSLNEKQILIAKTSDLPDDYLPDADSYFDETHYEDYALQLKENVLRTSNSLVFEHLLNEVLSLKRQQFETNQLLHLLVNQNKRALSPQTLAEPETGYVSISEPLTASLVTSLIDLNHSADEITSLQHIKQEFSNREEAFIQHSKKSKHKNLKK